MPADQKPPRVFISYTHDSPAHRQRVLELALKLREDGVDCEIDQFHEDEPPPEGWLLWMQAQIREADYVIVVCTATYHRRATGQEAEGKGLGARWEAQFITQALYDAGGKNRKFIPAVFGKADLEHRPEYLVPTTFYDLEQPTEREKLYWRVTRQPKLVKPPLGSIRIRANHTADTAGPTLARGALAELNTPATAPDLLLVRELHGRLHFFPLLSFEGGDTSIAEVVPDTDEERAYLENLSGSRYALAEADFAWGLRAARVRVGAVTHTRTGSRDRFRVQFGSDVGVNGYADALEMGMDGRSPDDIALLRARRILLDEILAKHPSGRHLHADSMLEAMVRGMSTKLPVESSPLPQLLSLPGMGDPQRLAAAARLTAVLWLRLSGTIAEVHRLDVMPASA